MRAYSEDLRQRVVAAVEQGDHPAKVSRTFKVSLARVKRFVKQKRERGHLRSQPPPGRPRKLSNEHEEVLVKQVREHQAASLEEHAELLKEATGQQVSLMTVQRTFSRLGITRKKGETTERA